MTHKTINQTGRMRRRVPTNITGSLQIFELKQMADMEATFKIRCRAAIKSYRGWQSKHAAETDVIELLYGNLEGAMLRRRAEDMAHLYWIIRQDFRRAFQEYLDKSCCYPSMNYHKKAA